MSDNRQIVVLSEGREDFDVAMKLAFDRFKARFFVVQTPNPDAPFFGKPKVYKDPRNPETPVAMESMRPRPTYLFQTEHPRLIFFWGNPSTSIRDAQTFPFEMDAEQAASFAWGWLKSQKYGHEPDHDGDNHRGFAVYQEAWGHIGEERMAICAVSPQWMMYGK